MADIFSKSKRSEIMRKIGPKNSTPELTIRKLIFSMGYRYRLHKKDLPGKPDIVFPKIKKIIFIHGCFWHNHNNCKRSILPKTNHSFWRKKINQNKSRDQQNITQLKKMGWKYLIIWQCQIKKSKEVSIKLKISKFLSQ